MITKLPIICSSSTCLDLLKSLFLRVRKSIIGDFCLSLSKFSASKYVYLTDSGLVAFYIILLVLKGKSTRKEIVLPAYTAASLVVAVMQAGLQPVFCDISLTDFNLDINSLSNVLTCETLAVVGVHMFGLPMQLKQLRKNMPADIFLIEDCAQAMGSMVDAKQLGGFGDVSFFSFNRGKNLPVYPGGCIATNNEGIAASIEKEIKNLKKSNLFDIISSPAKAFGFWLATKPWVFGLGHYFLSFFKDTALPTQIVFKRIDKFSASLGLILLRRFYKLSQKRQQNGMFLISALKDISGIRVPVVNENTYAAFNRLPILCTDVNKINLIEKRLWENGIETSRMYIKPLHRMFDLGYTKDAFPNANYFAEHLLVLPVYPSIQEKYLLMMVEVIRNIMSS
jgi:perosamine synthetase